MLRRRPVAPPKAGETSCGLVGPFVLFGPFGPIGTQRPDDRVIWHLYPGCAGRARAHWHQIP